VRILEVRLAFPHGSKERPEGSVRGIGAVMSQGPFLQYYDHEGIQ
jgi:hypothetical protein